MDRARRQEARSTSTSASTRIRSRTAAPGGAAAGIGTVVAFPTSTGSASSEFVPSDPGHYCFRAEYRPSDVAPYSPGSRTNKDTECFEAKVARPTLTVTKLCVPPGDPGRFDLVIDGATTNVGCGGTIGPIEVSAGPHKIRESAGSGLGDYTSVIGGACAADGSITLAAGDSKTCTITNGRTAKTGTLKVNKVCNPADDGGRFDVFVDDTRYPDVACGGTTGQVTWAAGKHTVREASGTGTSLGDYTSVIGGACAADGSITLLAGDSKTCTITNTHRPPQQATLTVNKICVPPDDSGTFDLRVDGATAKSNVPCGGTTGPTKVSPGVHHVDEAAAGNTDLGAYTSAIGGDCAQDGSITVKAGDSATCTITNVRSSAQTGTLGVSKVCKPADDGGRFDVFIDNARFANVACGASTGRVALPSGKHTIRKASGTDTSPSTTTRRRSAGPVQPTAR